MRQKSKPYVPPDRLINLDDIKLICGWTRNKVYQVERDYETFPQRVQETPRSRVRFFESEFFAFLRTYQAPRKGRPPKAEAPKTQLETT